MNTELINDIQDRLSKTADEITNLQKELIAIKVDTCSAVKAERKINPGIGCKVSYNGSGLVINSLPLEVSDIPELPISKITGLQSLISELPRRAELSNIYSQLDSIYTTSVPVKSGTKVNVDDHGFVTDVAELLPEDIPDIPISKVLGLQSILDQMQAASMVIPQTESFSTIPGNGCRITWDNKGRVIKSDQLRVADIPSQILDRLTTVETRLRDTATTSEIESMKSIINHKIDTAPGITSGIFTKVVVNSDGIVTRGTQLTKADIPTLAIADIPNLKQELDKKANKEDIDTIKDTISKLRYEIKNNSTSIPVLGIVNSEELHDVRHSLTELRSQIECQSNALPDIHQLILELNKLQDEVMTQAGRIAALEKQLNK